MIILGSVFVLLINLLLFFLAKSDDFQTILKYHNFKYTYWIPKWKTQLYAIIWKLILKLYQGYSKVCSTKKSHGSNLQSKEQTVKSRSNTHKELTNIGISAWLKPLHSILFKIIYRVAHILIILKPSLPTSSSITSSIGSK